MKYVFISMLILFLSECYSSCGCTNGDQMCEDKCKEVFKDSFYIKSWVSGPPSVSEMIYKDNSYNCICTVAIPVELASSKEKKVGKQSGDRPK